MKLPLYDYNRLFSLIFTMVLALSVRVPPCMAGEKIPPLYEDVPLPGSLSLCNEQVPLDNANVREMLEREFIIAVWDRAQVILWLKRAGRYFPHVEKRLRQESMPDDLKYIPIAESSLLTYVRSISGARGPWQFMKDTGRRNGLRKDRMVDERLHFERSTDAALTYLKSLRDMFGSWTLAIAAYNCGEARVKKEIREQKVRDYYRLNLPLETERYVFRILAAKIIMQSPERYGYRVEPERTYKPIACDVISVDMKIPLHITDVARALGTDFKTIKELNPQINGYYLPTGRYTLSTPPGTGPAAQAAIQELTGTAVGRLKKQTGGVYTVKPGDTLSHIALRTGISAATIRALNGLRGDLIRVGQKLRLKP